MNYIFNKEKLEQVLSDFYSSTDIAIALYDASERMVASAHAYSGCCSLIRSKEQCVKNCELSDLIHMKEVSKDRKILQYTCHAGLMETIFPIVYDDVLIAYLQIGQFRDEKQVYSTEKKLRDTAERYGLDFHKLHSLYGELSVISEEKLRAVCNIMEILIKSF